MIIYVGNMLSKHGFSSTTIETVGVWLESLYPLTRVSSKKNQLLRLLEMWVTVVKHRNKCKIILIDTYSGKAFFYAWTVAWLARLFNIKYVPILHGGELPLRFDRNPKLSKKFIIKSSGIISPSGYLKHEVEMRGWGRPVLIPNAIDISKYPYRIRPRVRPRLLWVRSFHKMYNPVMALDVLRALREKGFTEASLCMVGPDKDGSMLDFIAQVKSYGLQDVVEITGKLSKEEWIAKSENYDLFINTTNVDNAPVSVVEAMALGLLVISTNVGGIPFLLTDKANACLVNKNNTLEMSNTIIELVENPAYVNLLSVQGRKFAEQFSWDVVSEKWREFMRSQTNNQT